MSTLWFTSDTHFYHQKVAELRGFSDVSEYNEELVARWNERVSPHDVVWHLGDVGFGRMTDLMALCQRLNGYKHLITGNHDSAWPGHTRAHLAQRVWYRAFESVQAFAKIRIAGETVLMSHFPYIGGGDHTDIERFTEFRLSDHGEWLLHGHVHWPEKVSKPKSIHVGVDAWDLRPASLKEITELMPCALEAA